MWLYKILKFIVYLPIKLLFPCKVYGDTNLPKNSGVMIVSNHISALDIVFPAVIFKNPIHFVAKQNLWKNWFCKWFFNSLQCIPVSRGGNDFSAMKKIISTLNDGKTIAIYPEGTRNKSGKLDMLPFKAGIAMFAYKSGATIVPMVMLQPPKLFRKAHVAVGRPIHVEKAVGKVTAEMMEEFTQNLQDGMKMQLLELKERAWIDEKKNKN